VAPLRRLPRACRQAGARHGGRTGPRPGCPRVHRPPGPSCARCRRADAQAAPPSCPAPRAQAAADAKRRGGSPLPAAVAGRAAAVAAVLDQPDAASMRAAAARLADAEAPRGAPLSPRPADAAGLRTELAAVDAQQREAEALRAKLGSKLAALRESAAELTELQAAKRALEEQVRARAGGRGPAAAAARQRACVRMRIWPSRASSAPPQRAPCAPLRSLRPQVSALRADAAAVDALRAEHASLSAAAAEGEGVAAAVAELRAALRGTEGAAAEHAALAAELREAEALEARNEELRAQLEAVPQLQVGLRRLPVAWWHRGLCPTRADAALRPTLPLPLPAGRAHAAAGAGAGARGAARRERGHGGAGGPAAGALEERG
jgi:hypothetical protein